MFIKMNQKANIKLIIETASEVRGREICFGRETKGL